MDRKKKKQGVDKSAAAVELDRKKIKDDFLYRTKKIIKLVCNDMSPESISAGAFEMLYAARYFKLKIIAAPGSNITKPRIAQFNSLLQQFVEGEEVSLPNGNTIPISWCFCEGLTLIDWLGVTDTFVEPVLEELKAHFAFFSRGGNFHRNLQEIMLDIITDCCTLLSDYNDHIYRADLSENTNFSELQRNNEIVVHAFKPKKETIETKIGMRTAVRLGWPSAEFNWKFFNVKPSLLGFNTLSIDIPLELYISTHAFDRLQERINITPGIMHQILLLTFLEPQISHRWNGNESHVDFRLSDEKVGYLVVKLHGSKLVIHTFLFLTNNGTFEGEKLGRLVNIVKEDKKYLEIDNLPAFNAYHIGENEKLSQLFKDAGCGSLLKMGHLQEFTANQIADKNADSILRYMADAPYFSKLGS